MNEIIVNVGFVNFNSGVLRLSESQYNSRQHRLKKLGGGRYEILSSVGFKHGEKITYEGELHKTELRKFIIVGSKDDAMRQNDDTTIYEDMTKNEIIEALNQGDIKFNPRDNKKELLTLLIKTDSENSEK